MGMQSMNEHTFIVFDRNNLPAIIKAHSNAPADDSLAARDLLPLTVRYSAFAVYHVGSKEWLKNLIYVFNDDIPPREHTFEELMDRLGHTGKEIPEASPTLFHPKTERPIRYAAPNGFDCGFRPEGVEFSSKGT